MHDILKLSLQCRYIKDVSIICLILISDDERTQTWFVYQESKTIQSHHFLFIIIREPNNSKQEPKKY